MAGPDHDLPPDALAEAFRGQRVFADRHQEVLIAAMRLIAERGLAGASLRELARRVGVSQPSLYHWFDSKDQLVEQIIDCYTARIFTLPPTIPVLTSPEVVLRFAIDTILELWSREEYQAWVRFMFAISLERAEYGPLLQDRFLARGPKVIGLVLQPWVATGELLAEDADWMAQTVSGALVLFLIQDVLMLRRPVVKEQWAIYADFIASTVAAGARARAADRKEG